MNWTSQQVNCLELTSLVKMATKEITMVGHQKANHE